MEQDQMQVETPSYWPSVIIGAIIVAAISSILGILSQYMTISNEPTGAQFSLGQAVGSIVCLLAIVGGFIATRHYAKNNDVTFKIGKGAVIGFLTGALGAVFSTVLSLIWTKIIDTSLNQNFYDWQMRNLEAQNLPQEQFEMMQGFITDPGSTNAILMGLGIGILMFGILNLISGMIGAKIFASPEEDY